MNGDIMEEGRSQAILSSYSLGSWIRKYWLGYRQRRQQKVMKIGQKLRDLRNDRFDQEFSRTRHRYSLLCDLNWYWENPEKNEDTLCVLCMNSGYKPCQFWRCQRNAHYHQTRSRNSNWKGKDPNAFRKCFWGIHTMHKECYDDLNLCTVCSPLWDQH
jgi:hypothetical protein